VKDKAVPTARPTNDFGLKRTGMMSRRVVPFELAFLGNNRKIDVLTVRKIDRIMIGGYAFGR
jgi:hypothetical protein